MTGRAVPPSKVWARFAGVLFLFGVLTAASAELFLRGRLPFAAGLILVLCHVAATLLFYQIFSLVSPSLALLAVSFNFAGVLVLSFLLLLVMIFWLLRVFIMAHKETAGRAKRSRPPGVETRPT
ncbi:MAG TPA: hypothetical protein VKB61_09125 [Candidatus Acidoferrum sp.]|nr:hypothetical protein [Candidatus Acidoferrum sp.]